MGRVSTRETRRVGVACVRSWPWLALVAADRLARATALSLRTRNLRRISVARFAALMRSALSWSQRDRVSKGIASLAAIRSSESSRARNVARMWSSVCMPKFYDEVGGAPRFRGTIGPNARTSVVGTDRFSGGERAERQGHRGLRGFTKRSGAPEWEGGRGEEPSGAGCEIHWWIWRTPPAS